MPKPIAELHEIEAIVTPDKFEVGVHRMRVPGGWIYWLQPAGGAVISSFVPDADAALGDRDPMNLPVTFPNALPTTIAASGNWASGMIQARDLTSFACSLTLSQNGTLSVQRYLDAAGQVPVGAALTASLTANTNGNLSFYSQGPFYGLIVTVTNGSSSAAATVSNLAAMLAS